MAIAESLLDKLLRLETLQHRQRLDHIRQQLNELERYQRLAASLNQLAGNVASEVGITTGMQVNNRGHFHTLLSTMQQSCQRAQAEHAASVKSLAGTATVKMQRLERLRQRLHKSCSEIPCL